MTDAQQADPIDDGALRELGDTVERFVERHHPTREARRLADDRDGYDLAAWRLVVDELGLTRLRTDDLAGVPRLQALAVVQEQFGRTLAASPWFATVVLAGTLWMAAAPDDATTSWLHTGDTAGACAPGWKGLGAGRAEPARLRGDGSIDAPTPVMVVDGAGADRLVVATVDDTERIHVALVPTDQPGVVLRPQRSLDASRGIAAVHLEGVTPSEVLPTTSGCLARARAEIATLTAAETLGGMDACLSAVVAHGRHRYAFGRPVGSFQAVKHACADLYVELESARALVAEACRQHAEGGADFPTAAHQALSFAVDAYRGAAERQILLHGGIGFTWEHDAHLHVRRAMSSRAVLGGPDEHWELAASAAELA